MAASTQASPLLSLPPELRISIYELLLIPDPNRVHTLYDNIFGRVGPFHIDPTILRVNKQIYLEAVWVLYDNASIHINFGWPVTMQRTIGDDDDTQDTYFPPTLFRTDSKAALRSANKSKWVNPSPRVEDFEPERPLETIRHPGYIYPHCFRRLRRIHLVISRYAIVNGGSYYTPQMGQTVLRILKLLGDGGDPGAVTSPMMTKRLKLTLQPNCYIVDSQLRTGHAEMDGMTQAIVGLLKALQRRTNAEVEIEEGPFTMTLKKWKMDDAEIDKWEKVLLKDADTIS